jgi:hypothetical protein
MKLREVPAARGMQFWARVYFAAETVSFFEGERDWKQNVCVITLV